MSVLDGQPHLFHRRLEFARGERGDSLALHICALGTALTDTMRDNVDAMLHAGGSDMLQILIVPGDQQPIHETLKVPRTQTRERQDVPSRRRSRSHLHIISRRSPRVG
jgi:hypothetical protein